MNTEWSKPTKYIAGVSVILLIIFILYLGRSVLAVLIIAALIAMIVRPLIVWLHRRGRLPRGLAVAVVYLLLIFLIPLLLTLAVPAVIEAFTYFATLDYAAILEQATKWLQSSLILLRNLDFPIQTVDMYFEQLAESLLIQLEPATPVEPPEPPPVGQIIGSLTDALRATLGAATNVVGIVFSRIALLIFLILSSIYMSLGADTYRAEVLRLVPPVYRPEISVLLARILRTWNAFFRGELTLIIVIGVVTWLGLSILGLPGAASLGIIAGLLEIVPNIGPVIAAIPAIVVALLQGSTTLPVTNIGMVLIVIGFYIIVQQLENNLIVPRVLGDAVDLPALVVMSGVLIGASAFGILGALLATPVIASLREILVYIHRKILGEVPYAPDEVVMDPSGLHFEELVQYLRRRLPERAQAQGSGKDGPATGIPARLAALPEGITQNFVTIDGMRISYYTAGAAGPAVVLLHGGGMDSARLSWELLMPELASGFRVFAPDFPGYGASDKPDDFPYTVESLIGFLDQFLDAFEIEQAHLVGLSMGGAVAIGYTLEHPQRVSKLVLVDSYGLQRTAPWHALSYLFVKTPGVNALTWKTMRSRAAARWTMQQLLRRPGSLTEELMDLVMVEGQRPGAGKAWTTFQNNEMTRQGTRTVYLDRLHEINTPVLIVHGEKDTLAPPEGAREASQLIRGSRLVWIEGSGHWPQRDNPQVFNQAVRAFLEE